MSRLPNDATCLSIWSVGYSCRQNRKHACRVELNSTDTQCRVELNSLSVKLSSTQCRCTFPIRRRSEALLLGIGNSSQDAARCNVLCALYGAESHTRLPQPARGVAKTAPSSRKRAERVHGRFSRSTMNYCVLNNNTTFKQPNFACVLSLIHCVTQTNSARRTRRPCPSTDTQGVISIIVSLFLQCTYSQHKCEHTRAPAIW